MKKHLTEAEATLIFADAGMIDGEVINARDAAIRMLNSNFIPAFSLGTHDWVYLDREEGCIAVVRDSSHQIERQEVSEEALTADEDEALTTYLIVVGSMLTIVLVLLALAG